MLSDALLRGHRTLQVRGLLGQPWCWPADPALEPAARAISPPPAPLVPGRALLVTVSGDSACLWATAPEGGIATADLTDEARQISESAGRLAAAALPLVACADWIAHPSLPVRLVYTSSRTEQPRSLGGASCGLSLCLAEASRLLDVPLPSDLVASVALRDGAALAPVGQLARKVALLSDVALGVTRLLVAAGQEDEARAAVGRTNLEVIGVSSLSDALSLAFGDITEILRARWSADPEAARRSADALYEMALHNTQGLLDWGGLARSADTLRECLPEGSPSRAEAELAEQIAIRHAGNATPIRWPDEETLRVLRRVGRMWFVAHAVQSAADTGDDGVPEIIARAEPYLPARLEHGAEELRVRGAIGRARAAIGDYEGAVGTLRETVSDWLAIRAAPEASYPLSELLRVLALLGRAGEVRALEEIEVRRVLSHPETRELSRAFVLLSLGRAFVLLGEHDAALSALDSPRVSWALTPAHSRFARIRWRIRALRGLGRGEWEEEMRRLQGSREQAQLAALDRALWAGEPWQAHVDALAWDVDVRRLFSRAPRDRLGPYVADHYRY